MFETLSNRINPEDRKLVFEFCEERRLAPSTRINYLYFLGGLLKASKKPLRQITKSDIQTWIVAERARGIGEKTMDAGLTYMKSFYRWLNGGESPEVVKWISVRNRVKELPTDELLTGEDIKRLIEAANHPRDKALIAMLSDSGARIGELLNLKIKNVAFDKFGAVLIVSGKTGMRRIRLIDSTPYVQNWVNNHPQKDTPMAPLFLGPFGGIRIPRVNKMLRAFAKRAGVKKRVNPHSFRHARLTELAGNGLSERELRIFAGWSGSSEMPETYIHLSGKDLDEHILKIHGVIKEELPEEKKRPLKPIVCSRCKTINPADAAFCFKCSMALTLQAAVEAEKEKEFTDRLMVELLADEGIKRDVKRLLRKLPAMARKKHSSAPSG